ncbi:MAG: vitamin K epoxide reductase family protein [Georgenia sp.]
MTASPDVPRSVRTTSGAPDPTDTLPDVEHATLRRPEWRTNLAMLISSVISLVASFVLSVDALRLAADPNVALSCDINAAISCGTVAQAWQASLLGFPNAFLGIMTEPVVITIAVAGLAGVRFPRWFMLGAQGVYLLGLVFAYWLFAQSFFVIGALCPWCLLVTASTTTVFTSITRLNIGQNNFGLSPRLHARVTSWLRVGVDYAVVAAWFVLLGAAVLLKYQDTFFR